MRHIMVGFVMQNAKMFEGVADQIANLMGHALRQWVVSDGALLTVVCVSVAQYERVMMAC